MQREVEASAAAAVEAVPDVLTADGVDRGVAGIAGEVHPARQAPHVANVEEYQRGDDRANPEDVLQRAGTIGQRLLDARPDRLELSLGVMQVFDELEREFLAGLDDSLPAAASRTDSCGRCGPSGVEKRRQAAVLAAVDARG